MACPRLQRESSGFEPVSRAQPEPDWPLCLPIQTTVPGPTGGLPTGAGAGPVSRSFSWTGSAGHRGQRRSWALPQSPWERPALRQVSERTEQQRKQEPRGDQEAWKGAWRPLDPAIARGPSCWRPGGPAAPALRDWDPAGSTVSPRMGQAWKGLPSGPEQLWLAHTV